MAYIQDQDLMHQYQADILTQKTTDNPYIKKSPIASRNQQLNTATKTVTGAINEIVKKMDRVEDSVTNRLNENLEVLGDYPSNPGLITELKSIDTSIIEAILKIYKDINGNNLSAPEDISAVASSVKEAIQKLHVDVEEVKDKVVNYKESFVAADGGTYAQFKLKYVPIEESIRFQVNGVTYDCAYLPESGCVEWVFTDSNGGFDLDPSYAVTVFYDYLTSKQTKEN